MSSRKTTGVTFDLVPVAITAIGNQRTTCFPQIAHNTPAFVAAHRRTAAGNQRTACFPQIAHYTSAFVAAHRRKSLFIPAVRSSSKSQNWIMSDIYASTDSLHVLDPIGSDYTTFGIDCTAYVCNVSSDMCKHVIVNLFKRVFDNFQTTQHPH